VFTIASIFIVTRASNDGTRDSWDMIFFFGVSFQRFVVERPPKDLPRKDRANTNAAAKVKKAKMLEIFMVGRSLLPRKEFFLPKVFNMFFCPPILAVGLEVHVT